MKIYLFPTSIFSTRKNFNYFFNRTWGVRLPYTVYNRTMIS